MAIWSFTVDQSAETVGAWMCSLHDPFQTPQTSLSHWAKTHTTNSSHGISREDFSLHAVTLQCQAAIKIKLSKQLVKHIFVLVPSAILSTSNQSRVLADVALYHSYYSYRIVNRIVRYSALILLFKWKKSLERHFNKCQTVPSRNDTELTGRESVKHIPCSTRLIFVQIVAAPIWTETNLILHKSLAFQLCTEPTQACQPLTMLN